MSPIMNGLVVGLVLFGIEWLCVYDCPTPFTGFSWMVMLAFPVIAGLIVWRQGEKKK